MLSFARKLSPDIIEAKEELLYSAILNSDLETLDKLMHQDMLFVNQAGQIITKDMDLATYRSGNLVIDVLKTSDRQVRIIEDVALVTVKVIIAGKFNLRQFKNAFQYTRLWKQTDEGCKIISGSCITIPAA